jgi:DNA-binding response OmpR family regulator
MPRPTVLVCDDVEDIRRLIQFALTPEGFDIIGEATDGNMAVELAGKLKPDVVLLDINMPDKNGLAALPEVKAASPNSVVVMLSGFDARLLGQQALELGASDYIEKGTALAEIASRLKSLLGAA